MNNIKYTVMKQHILKLSIIMTLLLVMSCKESFLDISPLGSVSESSLKTPTAAEALVVSAYAEISES
jgi:hypothetical protein